MPTCTPIHKEVHLGQDGGDDINTGCIHISGSLTVPRTMIDCVSSICTNLKKPRMNTPRIMVTHQVKIEN